MSERGGSQGVSGDYGWANLEDAFVAGLAPAWVR